MKARTIIPLVIGLGVGIFAIKMGIDLVQEARSGQGGAIEVVVSASAIGVATRVTEPMLSTKSVPENLKPSDAFVDKQELVGRVTAMSVTPGVPITRAMLAPPGSQPGLRAKIPAGHRAVSISVNEESAVAGFLTPGSRVDVFAGGGKGGNAQLILSDVEVGAVGQSLSEVSKDGRTVRMSKSVTLFLRPEQVKILHKNAGSGRSKNLRLALRGNSEQSEKQGDSFWTNVLANAFQQGPGSGMDAPEGPTVLASARRRHVVEVVRGRDVERLVFVESDVAGEYASADDPAPEDGMGEHGFSDTDDSPNMEMSE